MSNSAGLVVSLAEMEQFYRGDKAGQIIELMNKTNDIMDDVLWMESNQSDGHLTRIRTRVCPKSTGAGSIRARRPPSPSGSRSRRAAAFLRPSWNWTWKNCASMAAATRPSA